MKTIKIIVVLAALMGIAGQATANSDKANTIIQLLKSGSNYSTNYSMLQTFIDQDPSILNETITDGSYSGPLGNYPAKHPTIKSYLQSRYNQYLSTLQTQSK